MVFGPQQRYEKRGDVNDVVFLAAPRFAPDRDTLRLCYGAADTSIALATGTIRACLAAGINKHKPNTYERGILWENMPTDAPCWPYPSSNDRRTYAPANEDR